MNNKTNLFEASLISLIFMIFIHQPGQAKNPTKMHKNQNQITKQTQITSQTAILAGGCFWGMQELFKKETGIIDTAVGYIGGNIPNPTYQTVSTGLSGYAEAVKIDFDPTKTSYEKILKFFFTIHDPTSLNRQQNDIGSQYRSEIFYLNQEQEQIAKDIILQANKSGVFKKPLATKVSAAGTFYLAENYHQNYLDKNPQGYTCHFIREDWRF